MKILKYFMMTLVVFMLLCFSTAASGVPEIVGDGDIRAREPVGLRVKAVIDNGTAISENTSEYGFIVTRKVFLDAKSLGCSDFSFDCGVPYTKGISMGVIDGEKIDIFFDRNDEEVFFSCHIHGIDEAFYIDELVVRTYIFSGNQVKYGTPFVTSLYDTAKSIYYNDERFEILSDEYQRKIFSMVACVENLGEHTVTFTVDGKAFTEQTIFENKSASLPENPEKEGYRFLGWSLNGGTELVDVCSMPIKEKTEFSAVFERIGYTVTFISDGKTHDVQSVWHKECAKLPAKPEKEHYNFIGWADDEGVIANIESIAVTGDKTFHAAFEKKSYNVIFAVDDAEYSRQSIKYEANALLPKAPSKEGYNFVGWADDKGTIVNVESIVVTSDITFYAVFEETWYSVVFVAGENECSRQTIQHKGNAASPEAPSAEGYDFIGWAHGETGEIVDISSYAIVKDTVFNAVFEIKKHIVSFMVGQDVFAQYRISHGSAPEIPDDPVLENRLVFLGWSTEPTDDRSMVIDLSEVIIDAQAEFFAVIIENPNSEEFIEKLTRGHEQLGKIRTEKGSLTRDAINLIKNCIGYVVEDANTGLEVTKSYVKSEYREMIDEVKDIVNNQMASAERSALVNILTSTRNIDEDVQDFLCEYFDIDMTQIK